jgi:hypothetical protein
MRRRARLSRVPFDTPEVDTRREMFYLWLRKRHWPHWLGSLVVVRWPVRFLPSFGRKWYSADGTLGKARPT